MNDHVTLNLTRDQVEQVKRSLKHRVKINNMNLEGELYDDSILAYQKDWRAERYKVQQQARKQNAFITRILRVIDTALTET